MPRLKAAKDALKVIYDYSLNRIQNFQYLKLVRKILPRAEIVIGGAAVSIFGKYVIERCPANSTVVIGEGEDVMLSIANGTEPNGDFFHKDEKGLIAFTQRKRHFDLNQLTAVDFHYIHSIFPDFTKYVDGYIGVQTKRGCPYSCLFCLYNKIEGTAERQRNPGEVAKEITRLSRDFGVKKYGLPMLNFALPRKVLSTAKRFLISSWRIHLISGGPATCGLKTLLSTWHRKLWLQGFAVLTQPLLVPRRS